MVTDPRAIQQCTNLGRGAPTPLLTPHADAPPTSWLMDWRGFHTELQSAAIAATQTGAPLSLLMLEQVGSDRVNRPHGAEVAAAAIGALAGVVRAVVGEHSVLARYSDGRLAVILIDTDLGEAVGRAERIADQVSSPLCRAADRIDLEATAAIGIAQFQDDESLGHLIQRTTEALKQARIRRGLAVVADPAARKRPSHMFRLPDISASPFPLPTA